MTDALTSQGGLIAAAVGDGEAKASQGGLVAVGTVSPTVLLSQGGLVAVGAVQPVNYLTQGGLVVIGRASACSTHRCTIWSIDRKDGVSFHFTSHDEDVVFGAHTYRKCHSLKDTASEQSAEAGEVGNIELSGLIDDDAISDADLFAGLFDDAYIQVWRISWDDPTDLIERVAAGNAGKVSQGARGWTSEVLGPGARMAQKALLLAVVPGCRFHFGDPATCGVDAESMAIGGSVVASSSRAYFRTDVIDPVISAQWDQGKLRWLYGANAGQECEVMTVDFVTGIIVLWSPAGFVPQVGDSFELLPGCDLAFDGGCTVYNNKDRFGGFPHVPGTDSIRQTPTPKA